MLNARRTDPVSSHIAAKDYSDSGKQKTETEKVIELVRNNQGSTAQELAFIKGVCICKISKRLHDARMDKQIKKDGVKICTVSKKRADKWVMA